MTPRDPSHPETGTRRRTRVRTLAVSLFVVVASISSLAVLAEQWRHAPGTITVAVTGTVLTTPDDIRALAAVPNVSVLADLDLLAIRKRVESHPVVREAVVRRNPPTTLDIEVHERTPVALLLDVATKDWLVDADGYVFPVSPQFGLHALPVISGGQLLKDVAPGRRITDRRLQQALAIISEMHKTGPDMSSLFSELTIEHPTDIVLYTLDAGVPVIFGTAEHAARKLLAFKAYWENVAIQRDVSELEYVDLRFRDQVVVRWRTGADAPATAAQVDTTGVIKD